MPAFVSFVWFKNDQVTNAGSLGIGQNIVQNRNATKQNNGAINVGDGFNNLPVLFVNADPDVQDQAAIDAQNFAGPQT
jgi:hypothetical protein